MIRTEETPNFEMTEKRYEAGSSDEPRGYVGTSPAMRQVMSVASRVGWSDAPVLIQGETGAGKEVLARRLHQFSKRANKPFLKLNCAALPSELVESELFGYERGAFTGAFQRKAGMFELADGGTLMLDEIGDMDVRLQAKLLQVLQDQEFHRLGGKELVKVDVRVIAATHNDLEQSIENGKFRADLYYRLSVINMHVPSLRECPEDILPLAEHFLEKHATDEMPVPELTAELCRVMTGYRWPGNVRELENVMRKMVVFGDAGMIVQDLQGRASRQAKIAAAVEPSNPVTVAASVPSPVSSNSTLAEVAAATQNAEKQTILAALHATRWHRRKAALMLKIDYKALLYKMTKLGITDTLTMPEPPVAEVEYELAATA